MVHICDCLVAQSIITMHKGTFTQAPAVPAALALITNDTVASSRQWKFKAHMNYFKIYLQLLPMMMMFKRP